MLLAVACGTENAFPPPSGGGGGTWTTSSGAGGSGPCEDGETSKCSVSLGKNGEVSSCMVGLQTCEGGTWGPCSAATLQPLRGEAPVAPGGTGSHATPRSSGPCVDNPCDPTCVALDETPVGGIPLEPTIEGYYQQATLENVLANTPSGFVNKGMVTPCAGVDDCQFDFQCVPDGTNGLVCPAGAAKCCTSWLPTQKMLDCPKPEFTTGFACTISGVPTVPVCNRGTVTAPAGVAVYIFPGNSNQYPTCIPDKSPGVCYTQDPIDPGKCVNVTGCPGLTGNGTKTVMVNGPLTSANVNNPAWQDECHCGNNWGVWSGNSTPCVSVPNYDTVPVTVTQSYEADCPVGSTVQWQYFAWDTTTPDDSKVVFQAHTATSVADLAAAPLVDLGTAKATPLPDTQKCLFAGPAPCPVNLYTALGSPAAHHKHLELSVTLYPNTNKDQGSIVNGWKVTYSCPWTE